MPIDAVIFDWGGTLTRWHDVDFHAESMALAQAVVEADHALRDGSSLASSGTGNIVEKLHRAGSTIWGWSRDEQRSATVDDLFTEAGLTHDPALLTHYYEFWEPHTFTDPEVRPTWTALREAGIRVGVLSNTIWTRDYHRGIFERDGVLDLLDGDVYTSEIAWTKPSPLAFEAAMAAVGVSDPARCVYVGDRLYDDVWGAQNAGMRAIHVPHSVIPREQVGHTEGTPDAVVHRLTEIPPLVQSWR